MMKKLTMKMTIRMKRLKTEMVKPKEMTMIVTKPMEMTMLTFLLGIQDTFGKITRWDSIGKGSNQ